MDDHDFGGYATMANRKCSDGRTITPEAFKHMDQQKVPLVWQHGHDKVENVLGHAILEHRDNGIYAYCYFNSTANGQSAKLMVEHNDLNSLSIYANHLVEKNKTVLHGDIREVSLVLSGANPDAKIDYVRIQHSDDPNDFTVLDDEAVFEFGDKLEHAEGGKTYADVLATLNEDQMALLEVMIQNALENPVEHADKDADEDKSDDSNDKKTESDDKVLEHKEGTMTRNVFDQNKTDSELNHGGSAGGGPTLTHSQIKTIWDDAKKMGSFKDAFLAHADEYGITNIEILFPDARAINTRPEFITRRMEWVEGVLNGTKKLPWARIKSLAADLTLDSARAKGYVKGNMKKEQFFAITKRETTPQTIYKKQKLDRDDIIDITDFDVVAWLWVEMYFMIREEFARAILVGDGREIDDPDKIFEDKIRPIAHDDPFYVDVVTVAAATTPDQLVEEVLRARNNYHGTNPKAYMTNATMTDMLLQKDGMNRRLYRNKQELANELGVSEIVEVPIMQGVKRNGAEVLMIIVNLADYAVGTDKGGELTKFDDFDIDFNQYKYLIEGRGSGALQEYKKAQVILRGTSDVEVTPTTPTFVPATGVVTIPTVTGVTYKNETTGATLAAGAQPALNPGQSITVEAVPNTGYYFPHNYDADWTFTRPAA